MPERISPSEIQAEIARYFGCPVEELDPGLRLGQPPWTSLRHVGLLFQLAERYPLRIDDVAVQRLTDVAAITRAVNQDG